MLSVERITLREIRLPLKESFRISSGLVSERRICLLQLTSSDGVTGWSECVAGEAPNYSDETIDTAWFAMRAWVAPRILKQELEGPEIVHGILERDFRGHRMASAAVEQGYQKIKLKIAPGADVPYVRAVREALGPRST